MIRLPPPEAGFIEKIIHLSDLHIRTGTFEASRYEEYMHVFKNLLSNISSFDDLDKTVAVITGDIFHHKRRLEASGIALFTFFIKELSSFCPVYIIQGNHDYQQEFPDEPDLLASFLSDHIFGENVAYMSESGHYIAGNVGFGLTSIRDMLLSHTSFGHVKELPEFPNPSLFDECITCKIALCHGMIENTKFDDYTCKDGLKISRFDGYDIGLFGDIHQQQLHNVNQESEHVYTFITDKFVWGYSGSLIQQNFGESPFGHGMLYWDISSNKVTTISCKAKSAFCKMEILGEIWKIIVGVNSIPLKNMLDALPKYLHLRINGKYTFEQQSHLYSLLSDKIVTRQDVPLIPIERDNTEASNSVPNDMVQTHITTTGFVNADAWIQELAKSIELSEEEATWLRDPKRMIEFPNIEKELLNMFPSLCKHLENSLSKLETLVDSYEKATVSAANTGVLTLESMSWGWLLCFGDSNFFNFKSLDKKIAMLNAPNGYGKTSFLEIIGLALFGEVPSSRKIDSFTSHLICSQMPKNGPNGKKQRAYTNIEFLLNGVRYRIKRTFNQQNREARLLEKTACIDRETETNEGVEWAPFIPFSEKVSKPTDDWINANICAAKDFYTTSMQSQSQDRDFFSMDSKTQLYEIQSRVNMDPLHQMINICDSLINAYGSSLKQLESAQDVIRQFIPQNYDLTNIGQVGTELHNATQELQDLEHKLSSLQIIPSDLKEADLLAPESISKTQISLLQVEKRELIESELKESTQYISDNLQAIGAKNFESYEVSSQMIDDLYSSKPQEPTMSDDLYSVESERIESLKNVHGSLEDAQQSLVEVRHELAILSSRIKDHLEIRPPTVVSVESIDELEQFVQNFLWDGIIISEQSVYEASLALSNAEKYAEKTISDWLACAEKCTLDKKKIESTLKNLKSRRNVVLQTSFTTRPTLEKAFVLSEAAWLESERNNYKKQKEKNVYLKELISKLKIKQDLAMQIEAASESIADLPFNAQCPACCAQPTRLHIERLRKKHDSIECSDLEIGAIEAKQKSCDEWIKRYESALAWNLEGQRQQWSHYEKYKEADIQRGQLDKKIEHEEAELLKVISSQEIANEAAKVLEKAVNATKILEKHKIAHKHQAFQYCKWIALYKEFEQTKEELQASESEIKDHIMRLEHKREFEPLIEKIAIETNIRHNYREWLDKYNLVLYMFHEQRKMANTLVLQQIDIYLYKQKIDHFAPIYSSRKKLEDEITLKNQEITKLKSVYAVQCHETQRIRLEMQKHTKVKACYEQIVCKRKRITAIRDALQDYKRTVYTDKILPGIVQQANIILSALSDRFILIAEMFKDVPTFWILDDGNKVRIEKASGFQRFALGLVLRIALAQIGGRVFCDTFFVDEGFSSCDSAHLTKIPNFLRRLLAHFKSIILVSHLDQIRDDMDDHSIVIKRKHGLSFLELKS